VPKSTSQSGQWYVVPAHQVGRCRKTSNFRSSSEWSPRARARAEMDSSESTSRGSTRALLSTSPRHARTFAIRSPFRFLGIAGANKKAEGIASGLLLLFQWPTGLADGFGLKELPYSPCPCREGNTPQRRWVPRFRFRGTRPLFSFPGLRASRPARTLTIAGPRGAVK
jgi:hypothetical protein